MQTRLAALLLLATTSLGALSASAEPASLDIDQKASKLGFVAFTKLFDVEGTFGAWRGTVVLDEADPARSSLRVEVDVASLDTGIDARDEHLRAEDFLHTKKHEKATLVSRKIVAGPKGGLLVTADLTIRGRTKHVTFPLTLEEDGERLRAKGKLSVNRFDYGVNYKATLLTPSVEERVDIVFDIRMKKRAAALPPT